MELSARGTHLSGSVVGLPAARGLISQLKVAYLMLKLRHYSYLLICLDSAIDLVFILRIMASIHRKFRFVHIELQNPMGGVTSNRKKNLVFSSDSLGWG